MKSRTPVRDFLRIYIMFFLLFAGIIGGLIGIVYMIILIKDAESIKETVLPILGFCAIVSACISVMAYEDITRW